MTASLPSKAAHRNCLEGTKAGFKEGKKRFMSAPYLVGDTRPQGRGVGSSKQLQELRAYSAFAFCISLTPDIEACPDFGHKKATADGRDFRLQVFRAPEASIEKNLTVSRFFSYGTGDLK
jgi:hypothetical protein